MPDPVDRQVLSDRSGSEWLVHPLIQTARGYLTDEDVAVEATLTEAVERAKDLETSNERLRTALGSLGLGVCPACGRCMNAGSFCYGAPGEPEHKVALVESRRPTDEKQPVDPCEGCDQVQQCLRTPCSRLASRETRLASETDQPKET